MKRLFIALCMAAVAIFGGSRLNAQTIFDTGVPENLFRFGVRLGFNTSNLTNNYDKVMSGVEWKDNQWRGGFNAGFVVDINFRNFFAIQPGAFIYTRKTITICCIPTGIASVQSTALRRLISCRYLFSPLCVLVCRNWYRCISTAVRILHGAGVEATNIRSMTHRPANSLLPMASSLISVTLHLRFPTAMTMD